MNNSRNVKRICFIAGLTSIVGSTSLQAQSPYQQQSAGGNLNLARNAPLRIGGPAPTYFAQTPPTLTYEQRNVPHQHVPIGGYPTSGPQLGGLNVGPGNGGHNIGSTSQGSDGNAYQLSPMTVAPNRAPNSNTAPLPPVYQGNQNYSANPAPSYNLPPNSQSLLPQPLQQPAQPVSDHYADDVYSHGQTPSGYSSSSQGYASPNGMSHGVVSQPGESVVYADGTYGADGSCGVAAPSCAASYVATPVAVSPFFGGVNALIFNRVDTDYTRLSTDANNPMPQALSIYDSRMKTTGGAEYYGGRYFQGGKYAITGSYWSLDPSNVSRTIYGGGGVDLQTALPFNFLPGDPAGTEHGITMPALDAYGWYDNAQAHRISRGQDYQSADVNLVSFALGGAVRQGYAGSGFGGAGYGGGSYAGGYGGGGWANGRFGRSGYSGGYGNRVINGSGGGYSGGYGIAGGRGHGRLGRGGYSDGSCGGESCGCGSCGGNGDSCGPSCGYASTAVCSGPTWPCGPIIGAQCSPLRFSMFGGFRWFRFGESFEYATSQDDNIIGNGTDFYYRNGVRNNLYGFQLGGLANYCCGSRFSIYTGSKVGIFGNNIDYSTFAGNDTAAATIINGTYAGQNYQFSSNKVGASILGEGELGGRFYIGNGWSANCGYRLIGVTGIATAAGQIPRDFSQLNDAKRINHDQSLFLHGVSVGAGYNW